MGVNADPAPGAEAKPVVPAVERAIAALRHLQAQADPRARTVTGIAAALAIHKSSCSNLLWTLEAAGLVEYAADTRAFQLGVELISLGASAAKDRRFVQAASGPMETLVRATGFTCVAYEQLPSDEFVIVGKVESPREIKVTIDVGQHFHPATPALAQLVAAFSEEPAAKAYLKRWGERSFTPTTTIDPAALAERIAFARAHGYAVSRGEYYAGNTAVAAPVFAAADGIVRGLCLVAFNEEVADAAVPEIGARLRHAAEAITRALGGRAPEPMRRA